MPAPPPPPHVQVQGDAGEAQGAQQAREEGERKAQTRQGWLDNAEAFYPQHAAAVAPAMAMHYAPMLSYQQLRGAAFAAANATYVPPGPAVYPQPIPAVYLAPPLVPAGSLPKLHGRYSDPADLSPMGPLDADRGGIASQASSAGTTPGGAPLHEQWDSWSLSFPAYPALNPAGMNLAAFHDAYSFNQRMYDHSAPGSPAARNKGVMRRRKSDPNLLPHGDGDRDDQNNAAEWRRNAPSSPEQPGTSHAARPQHGMQRRHDKAAHGAGAGRGSPLRAQQSRAGTSSNSAYVNAPSALNSLSAKGRADTYGKALTGCIVQLSQQKSTSRFVQQAVAEQPQERVQAYFDEIIAEHALPRLMMDIFGNYVMQKFLDVKNPKIIEAVCAEIVQNARRYALHSYGCRVMQRAIELCDDKTRNAIAERLCTGVDSPMLHHNGNHVVQKLLECMSREDAAYIVKNFKGRVQKYASHVYGCRVIQCIIKHLPVHCFDPGSRDLDPWMFEEDDAGARERPAVFIVREVLENVLALSLDAYGNYVVQHAMRRGTPAFVSKVTNALMNQSEMSLKDLACHQSASNVIELCLLHANETDVHRMVSELLMLPTANENDAEAQGQDKAATRDERLALVVDLLDNPFGNYVLQKAIEQLDGVQLPILISTLSPHATELRRMKYGRIILTKLDKLDRRRTAAGGMAGTSGGAIASVPAYSASVDSELETAAAHLAARIRHGELALASFEEEEEESDALDEEITHKV